MTEDSIGVDISKSHLDVHWLEPGLTARFENTARGFRDLTRWLPKAGVARIVFEPTGPYHKAFEAALGNSLPLVKVNPLQARRFAEAHGTRAKTDAVDARMLARMGSAFGLAPQAVPSKDALALKELHVARRALVKDRTRLMNREKTLTSALLKRQAKARLAQAECQISEIDAEIHKLVTRQEISARSFEILCSIPGLGKVSAAALLTEMPELGSLDRKQVASLAGLAPVTRESGQWRGKAFIRGGRKPLRDALYMPAVVAMRFNPDLKRKYDDLRAAGKPAKVAIIALMRKLIELANTLVKHDRKWTPREA
jgi:transposase